MSMQTKAPRPEPGRADRGAEAKAIDKRIHPKQGVKPALGFDYLCDSFAGHVQDNERRLVSAAIAEPVEAFNNAVEHQLSGNTFSDPILGSAFACVLTFAEAGPPTMASVSPPRLSTAFRRLLESEGVHFSDDDLTELVLLEWAAGGAGIAAYSRRLADDFRRRWAASEHLRRAAELLGERVGDFEIIVRRRHTLRGQPCLAGEVAA